MAAWGVPVTLDDFTKAVSTALEIQRILLGIWIGQAADGDLALKIGVAGGPVYMGTIGAPTHQSFTVIGPARFRAIQLSDIAKSGQTLVDQAIYRITHDTISYEQLGTKIELAEHEIQPYGAVCFWSRG